MPSMRMPPSRTLPPSSTARSRECWHGFFRTRCRRPALSRRLDDMNTNPKACIEPGMSPGQFYKADNLVEPIYQNLGGFHLCTRTVHADDGIYAVKLFTTLAAKTLSRAAHFQENGRPVTTCLSGASGDPNVTATVTVAMAMRFHFPNCTIIDLIGVTLSAFYSASSGAYRKNSIRPTTSVNSSPRRAVCAAARRSKFRGPRLCATSS